MNGRLWSRKFWAALQLATSPDVQEALMRGLPVPRERLRAEMLVRLAEPTAGDPFVLTEEMELLCEMSLNGNGAGESAQTFALTDLGNAELFAMMHSGRLKFVKARRHWHVWQTGRWRRDPDGEADRAAKLVARELLIRAANIEDPDGRKKAAAWALQSQSEQRIRAMLSLAGTEAEIALDPEQLDADPWLLTCANGTLDLRTGTLREHDPGDLISLATDVSYNPDATCQRWLRFLREVFQDDHDLVGFVRRAVGYSLTGDTREHILFVLHGSGCNGKSTLVETVHRVCGDLACTSPFDSFARVRDRGIRNDVARLHRARLVIAAESGEGRRLDEATVKILTGGDTVAARFLYAEFFEFRPSFKIWLVTNHRPRVDGDDDAIWRRLRLVPFNVSFLGREDQGLRAALEAELPGILAWAVQGCLEWQRHGLGLPAAVDAATREYREDEDVLGAFIDERCILDGEIDASTLREAYEQFCKQLGERPLPASVLGKRLAKRAVTTRRGTGGARTYCGLRLRVPE
jgi:putative DNA primase/helicase